MVVRIRGLQAAPQLNGMQAVCRGFDDERGRWHVQLENGEFKALKPDNLLPVIEVPAPDVVLDQGAIVHVPLGRVALLSKLEDDVRENLQSDLRCLGSKTGVEAELDCPEGWPQFSAVLKGEPEKVREARPELGEILSYYGFGQPAGKKPDADNAGAAEAAKEEEEAEKLEVEGMEIKSMPKRERKKQWHR
eukprot:gnl/TRDRNA2_/TRDRNA2_81504_c0_seq1.p1 gnl/TRDRNA2_/TRDRNA2_81504_c0~~gnl/TRDRNA2_/TRDRNA2_81504_c0_seq1.p1  ORF type:complete len:191 (+),score=44.87 gnl/TRDRNA2_/TRDRNA2_81504_c0_seq1:42-614(+)